MDSEEEKYEPVEPNFYNYTAKECLINDIDNYLETNTFNQIKIVAYEVNNDGIYPFLQFLLLQDTFSSTLTLPFIPINYNSSSSEQIINMAKVLFIGLNLTDNYESFVKNIVFDGFYEYNGEMFLFVDLTNIKIVLNDIYYDTLVRFALIDEILNQKQICNINIDKSVTDFFNSNYGLNILKDEKNEPYELPITSYVGRKEKMLNFTYVFGCEKQNKNAILGPHYYFTDFKNAVNDCICNSKCKCGIVRFAVFTKNTKYIENSPNDAIDESETKKMRLNDDTLDNNYERLTMRITDYDGNWSENYDSCYLGNIELDNGEYLKNTPILVVKEYRQQVPLSYHHVKKVLGEKMYEIV